MRMNKLTDKVIIITGGSKGIGRETAKLFASQHAQVIITGRHEPELIKTATMIKTLGYRCDYYVGDVTKIEDCTQIVAEVYLKYQHIDALINNAGMSMRGSFLETDIELFHKIIDINFLGAVNMTKMALPHLITSNGSILFISSLSGLKGLPGIAPYGTAKMALTGFSESLRAELSIHRVHVGIIYVGFTENDPDKKIYSATGEMMPLNRAKNNDTQQGVARSIVKSLTKRKRVMYLTCQGKIAQFMYRFFPRLSGYLIEKFAVKSKRYQ